MTRVVVDPPASPAEHMAIDADRLDAAHVPGTAAALRVYTFAGPALTLGRGQSPPGMLDLARCAAEGVRWAVRPTGGGAVLHADEWTVGFACRLDDPAWPGGPRAIHRALAAWLAAALSRLGVPARLETRGMPAARPACFAGAARHELVAEGRKLAGLASRVTRTAMLVQGSVLLGDGHAALAELLRGGQGPAAPSRRQLGESAVGARHWLGAGVTLTDFADALRLACPPAPHGDASALVRDPLTFRANPAANG